MLNDLYNINAMKPCKLYLHALIMPGHIKKGHAKLEQVTSLTGVRTAIFSLEDRLSSTNIKVKGENCI